MAINHPGFDDSLPGISSRRAGRSRGRVNLASDDPDVLFQSLSDSPADENAKGRHEEEKTHRIGEKTRCQQKGGSDQNHKPVHDFFVREATLSRGLAKTGQSPQPLDSREPGSRDGSNDDNRHRRRNSDLSPNLHEQNEFNERHRNEE